MGLRDGDTGDSILGDGYEGLGFEDGDRLRGRGDRVLKGREVLKG